MKLIYIAHPFGGKQENVQRVETIIKKLLAVLPDNYTFYSPLHATGFLYNIMPYERGMEHCFEVLSRCDELWLCEGWENSRGCRMEKEYAEKHNIPISYVKEHDKCWTLLKSNPALPALTTPNE